MSDGINGLATAAQLLTNGTNGLSDALGNYGRAQTQLADNAAAQAAARFQDPDALKAALANGSLLGSLGGVDPSRVDAATLGTIQNRVGSLLNEATTKQNFDQTAITNARSNSQADALSAASPAIAALSLAASKQDKAGVAQAMQDPAFAKLTPDQILSFAAKGQGLEQGDASLTGTNINNSQRSFDLSTAKRNDQDTQAALTAMSALSHAGDETEARTRFNTEFSNLSPGASAIVRAALDRQYGTGAAGVAGVPAAGAGSGAGAGGVTAALSAATGGNVGAMGGAPLDLGTPGTKDGGVYNVTYGYGKTDQPITTMSIADLTKDGGLQDQLQKSKGNSPIGAYQINRDTLKDFAAKLNLPVGTAFTPAVQDQLGKAIFDARKSGDLTGTWSSLKGIPGADQKGAFANISWDQMKQLIQKQEGTAQAANGQDLRNNATQLLSQLGDVNNLMQGRIDYNRSSPVEKAIAAGAGSTTSETDEAANLIASNAAFKGADLGQTVARIHQITEGAGINPKAAATLLANNVQNRHGKIVTAITNAVHNFGIDSDRTWLGDTLPSGASVNDDAVTAAISQASGGKGVLKYNQTQHTAQLQAQLAAAGQAVQVAATALANARQKAKSDPQFTGLQRYQDAYDAAMAQAALLRSTAVNDASVNFPAGFKAPG
jgi:hypothetical protein